MVVSNDYIKYLEKKHEEYDGLDVKADAPQSVVIESIIQLHEDCFSYFLDDKEIFCHTKEYALYLKRKYGNKLEEGYCIICD